MHNACVLAIWTKFQIEYRIPPNDEYKHTTELDVFQRRSFTDIIFIILYSRQHHRLILATIVLRVQYVIDDEYSVAIMEARFG